MNGIILDQSTGAPLTAVNVFASSKTGQPVGSKGTTTDQEGRFTIDFDAEFITFRYIGFKPITLPNKPGFVIIEMLPTSYDLPPVTIRPPRRQNWFFLGLLAALAWDQSRPRGKRLLKL